LIHIGNGPTSQGVGVARSQRFLGAVGW